MHLRTLLPAATLLGGLILWELAVRLAGSGGETPAPSAIAVAIARDIPYLARVSAITLGEAAAGLALAVLAAFCVASAFAVSPLARTAFMPLVLAAQTIPMLAIAPLLARVIGEGLFSNIVVTAYLCWFPAIISFTHGLLNVDPRRLALFQVHRATPAQTWRRLRLPNAAPTLVAGVRTSAGLALISAIVTEYGTLAGGIGAAVVRHVRGIEVMPADRLFALVVAASLLGIAFTEAAHKGARLALRRWLPEG